MTAVNDPWVYLKIAMTATVTGWFLLMTGTPARADSDFKNVDLSFKVRPVFAVRIQAGSGGSVLDFENFSASAEPPSQTLEVEVLTNVRESYRVYHSLEGDITNPLGATLPSEQLLFRVRDGQKGGQSHVPQSIPVPVTEVPIFQSRMEGGSDAFRIDYQISSNRLLYAGLYQGEIRIRTE